jgi:hypothetical protein
MPLSRQARLVCAVLPARSLFRFALRASRLQGRLAAAMGGNGKLTEALMLDLWLRELTMVKPFPIPWRLHGRDVIERFVTAGPMVFTWTHLPAVEMPLRSYLESGYPAPAVVADAGNIVNGDQLMVYGWKDRIQALPASAQGLARMRRLLQQGTSVICLSDERLGGPMTAHPLELARKLHVPVIFTWANLAEDGVIDTYFEEAVYLYCEDEHAIRENLEYMRAAKERVLRSLGMTPEDGTQPAPTATTGQPLAQ